MKKILALLLAGCMMLALIGCGSTQQPSKTEVSGGQVTEPSEQADKPNGVVEEPGDENTEENTGVPTPLAYTIVVANENSEPVKGVTIQFCSDTACMTGKTDESGLVSFEMESGNYTVHVLKVPDGFEKDDAEYEAVEPPAMTSIVLKEKPKDDDTISAESIGYTFKMPEKYKNAKGNITWTTGGMLQDGIIAVINAYEAVPEEDLEAYNQYYEELMDAVSDGKEEPEAPNPNWGTGTEWSYLFEIYAVDGNHTKDDLLAALKEFDPNRTEFLYLDEIEKQGDWTFYIGQYKEVETKANDFKKGMGDLYDEFVDIAQDKDTYLSALTLSEPTVKFKELKKGDTVAFVTKDFDGNEVNSEDLFLKADVTMINLWGTWCGYCVRELPELAEIAKEYNSEEFQLVGVCNDALDDDTLEEAKALLAKADADYLNLQGFDELENVLPTMAFPMTIFVDSAGTLVLDPIYGANIEQYRASIEQMVTPEA